MKYTTSKEADKKIKKDMKIICKEILKKIKEVDSVILTGGFSRGEGAVKIENGKIFPYNDYDIQIISKEKISKEEIDKISNEISRKLGYKGIINFYPFKKENQKAKENFYIDLKCNHPKELKKMLLKIRTYELKNYSKILYGKDLRHLISNYNLKDIPLSEGAKLLLDRMSQMIEYYSTKEKYEKEFLTYIIQQAYAAICTSLLLLSGKYQIGYKKSARIFKKNYKEDFPELCNEIPDLDKKIEEFINWKLDPKKPKKNAEEEWFMARKNILEVSKYFFSKFLNKKIETTEELSNTILNMRKEFYLPYLRNIIKNKIGIDIKGFSCLLLPLISMFLKLKYSKRLKKLGVRKFLFFSKSPELIIFSSLIYIISSIDKNEVNEEMLKKGQRLLRKVYPSKGKNWEEISLEYANAYITFFLQKI